MFLGLRLLRPALNLSVPGLVVFKGCGPETEHSQVLCCLELSCECALSLIRPVGKT